MLGANLYVNPIVPGVVPSPTVVTLGSPVHVLVTFTAKTSSTT